jgi:hypothetical protein
MAVPLTMCVELRANEQNVPDDTEAEEDVRLFAYRQRTIQLLRRYMRLAIETGRLPSLLGSMRFRARITSYRLQTFEDAVIFVHDVERCVEKLDGLSQGFLARVILQEYTEEETARMLHCGVRTVQRGVATALDRLSRHFLRCGILQPWPTRKNACQEGESDVFRASVWKEGE